MKVNCSDPIRRECPSARCAWSIEFLDIDKGGAYDRGEVRAELDIDPSLWFFHVTFAAIRSCQGASDSSHVAIDRLLTWHGAAIKAWVARWGRRGALLRPGTAERQRVTYRIEIKRVIVRKLIMVIGDGFVR